ncbi:unnamed protein product, partial [Rhizoctonia solani]
YVNTPTVSLSPPIPTLHIRTMRTGVLLSTLSATSFVLGLKPEDDRPIPLPTRPLEWEDVNVLHTTDIHGWVLGHPKNVYPEKSWSGTFGDFYSFLNHMRQKADDQNVDLLLVDTGDRRIGHGLTDRLLDPETINGQAVPQLYLDLRYDAIVPGNHDLANSDVVKFIMNSFADRWNGKFITSNVRRRKPQKAHSTIAGSDQREFLGAPYRYWKTKNKNKIMAFSAVLSGARVAKELISITPVSEMVEEDWFVGALMLPTDVFMIIGHVDAKNPLPKDDMKLIHDAIRKRHPLKPIIMFAGHSHQRYCDRFATPGGSWRSMILQSGRYFDTVGWMSTKLDDNTVEKDLVMTRRYLDNNVETYKFHTNKNDSSFHTRKGREITNYAYGVDRSEGLSRVYGYLNSSYYLDRKEWTEDEKDSESLFSFYLNATEDVLIDKSYSKNWMFFSNWGILRGDIYSGPFTIGDFYQIIQQLQSNGRSKFQPDLTEPISIQASTSQHPLSIHTTNSGLSSSLTYGWKTRDYCGKGRTETDGEGDDVEHEPIPRVSFENGPPVFFWRKSYRGTKLAASEEVDLIFTNRIGQKVPEALNQITNSKDFNDNSIKDYPTTITQDKRMLIALLSFT